VILLAVGLAGGWLVPGCTTYRDPVTGQEARYRFETLRAELDLPIRTVYTAAKRATSELDLRSTRAAQDGLAGEIRAVNAQLETVDIQVGALPGGRTELSIRVGVFGDRDKSIVLFESIMANLSAPEQLAAVPSLRWDEKPLESWR